MKVQPLRCDALVPLAAERASDALRCYVAEHSTIAVRASCAVPALETEIAMVRDVIVTFDARDDECVVHWSPADGGVFPRFVGTLCVVADDVATAILRLEGTYDDPSSRRADRTDAELGFRLSQATARAVLLAIGATLDRNVVA